MSGATIFAPATAPGRAGVAMIRVSGAQAAAACHGLTGRAPPPPRHTSLRRFADPRSGEPIDRGLVLWFAAPRSSTGEDVLELQHHGGRAVLAALLEALAGVPGLRPAEPGEFTKRAFLAGKLDITAAEGLADLVDAATRAQARQALRQMDGALAQLYGGWRQALVEALALVEAEIDFAPDQDLPSGLAASVTSGVSRVREALRVHLADPRGERLREGVVVAVTGAPNVGKSSLVNLLAKREVAIVTPWAGTTRDVLEVQLELDGLPLTLLDTAGLRAATDPIEAAGIERARARVATADVRLVVLDATCPDVDSADGAGLRVLNKIDLARPDMPGTLPVSCRTGAGLDQLLARLTDVARELTGLGETALLTRARHRAALCACAEALDRHLQAPPGTEIALLAEELRLAAQALGRLTGAVGVEEVLDQVFARFCIGK